MKTIAATAALTIMFLSAGAFAGNGPGTSQLAANTVGANMTVIAKNQAWPAAGKFAQGAVRNYFAPEQDGKRLDSCLTDASDCGKPAADAFCKAQGFDTALIFQREAAVDTIRFGTGSFCTGAACASFRQIKCYAAAGTVAATN